MKTKKIVFVLMIFLILFSGYLAISDFLGSEVCLVSADGKSSCSLVQGSKYGEIFGIKVSYLGPLAFLLLLVIYYFGSLNWKHKQQFYEFFLVGVVAGVLGALYFISVQAFVLKAFCSTCLVVDFGMLVLAFFVFREHFRKRR